MYWEYIVYSQYMGGLKWKPWIPGGNNDVIYEHSHLVLANPSKNQPSPRPRNMQYTWLYIVQV